MHYYKKINLRHSKAGSNARLKRKIKQLKRFSKYVAFKQSLLRFNAEYLLTSIKFLGIARNAHEEPFLLRLLTWFRIFLFKHKLKFAC